MSNINDPNIFHEPSPVPFDVSSLELSYIDGLTSNAQAQLNTLSVRSTRVECALTTGSGTAFLATTSNPVPLVEGAEIIIEPHTANGVGVTLALNGGDAKQIWATQQGGISPVGNQSMTPGSKVLLVWSDSMDGWVEPGRKIQNVDLPSTSNSATIGAISAVANAAAATIALHSQYILTTGSANAYVATPATPWASYADGNEILLKIHAANTTDSTVAVSGLSTPQHIYKRSLAGNVLLTGGELPVNTMCKLVYNSTVGGLVIETSFPLRTAEMIYNLGTTGGTLNAYTASFPGIELVDGTRIMFRVNVANGSTPTLSINGGSAATLVAKSSGLGYGYIATGRLSTIRLITATYDSVGPSWIVDGLVFPAASELGGGTGATSNVLRGDLNWTSGVSSSWGATYHLPYTASSDLLLQTTTVDGADNKSFILNHGNLTAATVPAPGSVQTRGSAIFGDGNEHATRPGQVSLCMGEAGSIKAFRADGTLCFTIASNGICTFVNGSVFSTNVQTSFVSGDAAIGAYIFVGPNTANTADTGYASLTGGGGGPSAYIAPGTVQTRGAMVHAAGNEHATRPGQVSLVVGEAGYVSVFNAAGVEAMRFTGGVMQIPSGNTVAGSNSERWIGPASGSSLATQINVPTGGSLSFAVNGADAINFSASGVKSSTYTAASNTSILVSCNTSASSDTTAIRLLAANVIDFTRAAGNELYGVNSTARPGVYNSHCVGFTRANSTSYDICTIAATDDAEVFIRDNAGAKGCQIIIMAGAVTDIVGIAPTIAADASYEIAATPSAAGKICALMTGGALRLTVGSAATRKFGVRANVTHYA